jgi:hypothetical protein
MRPDVEGMHSRSETLTTTEEDALLAYIAELEAAIEAYCTPVCVDCELQGCELYPYRKEHHD